MISKLASVVSQQVPGFIREDYPLFVAFLEAYYEWMDQNTLTGKLSTAKDIDSTIDLFMESFKQDFAVNIPTMQKLDTKEFLRNAKAFYTAKGSEASYKFLFRAMYGKEVSVFYPEALMLRASDGRWLQDISIVVKVVSGNAMDSVGQRLKITTNTIHGTNTLIKQVKRVKWIRDSYYEIFFNNDGYFKANIHDTVQYNDFTAVIQPVFSEVKITNPGRGFKQGQIFSIDIGEGIGAKIQVTRIDANGGIVFAKPVAFGSGYSDSAFYGKLASRYSNATTNAYNYPKDFTVGLIDDGLVYNEEYTSGYVSGYSGTLLKSWVNSGVANQENKTYDESDVANIEIRYAGVAKYPGYFSTNNGFLSDTVKTQDNFYYQIYSYVLKIDEQISVYKDLVKSLLHPAGMAMFADYELNSEFDMSAAAELLGKILLLKLRDVVLLNQVDEVFVKSMIKVLSDVANISDTKVFSMNKLLADSISPTDSGTIGRLTGSTYFASDYGVSTQFYADGIFTSVHTF